MSAITIAQNTLTVASFDKKLLEVMREIYPDLPSVEEMLQEEKVSVFFAKKGKKKSSLPEERQGVYNGEKCDARVWKEKKGTGGLGYDNIQCSSKKVNGQCFCKRHSKAFSEGVLWLGKVTEPRPENPTKPDGTVMGWSTDSDGNDVVKEKKKKS